jgi:hypothetical protein
MLLVTAALIALAATVGGHALWRIEAIRFLSPFRCAPTPSRKPTRLLRKLIRSLPNTITLRAGQPQADRGRIHKIGHSVGVAIGFL